MDAGHCVWALCSSNSSKLGLDIDKRILAAGREQLSDDMVGTKRPTLEIITEESLARVAARTPRWVCSNVSCSTYRLTS